MTGTIFYIEKAGIYKHGVFWIGTCQLEGRQKVDEFAELNKDDWHYWSLKAHRPFTDKDDVDEDFEGLVIYQRDKNTILVDNPWKR